MQGMKDLFSYDINVRNWIYSKILGVIYAYGYTEVQTPILEKKDLFIRGIGSFSDIIAKEIYTLEGIGPKISLRPEGTVGIGRALFENRSNNQIQDVIKVFYRGSMFRHDRPQKGRMREFTQFGCELFGIEDPIVDVEMIYMAYCLLSQLPIGDFILHINTIGNIDEREVYIKALREYFMRNISELCTLCRNRLDQNTLRILDCKSESCKSIVEMTPNILDYLGKESSDHFNYITVELSKLKVPFIINCKLVRGLDYYNRTVFEFISHGLGSQNSIMGGGRYDSLIYKIAGINVPALGFALGIERIELLIKMSEVKLETNSPDLTIIYMDHRGKEEINALIYSLRALGPWWIDYDYRQSSVKAQMRRANRIGAKRVVFIGEKEAQSGCAVVRDMQSREEYMWDIKNQPLGFIDK